MVCGHMSGHASAHVCLQTNNLGVPTASEKCIMAASCTGIAQFVAWGVSSGPLTHHPWSKAVGILEIIMCHTTLQNCQPLLMCAFNFQECSQPSQIGGGHNAISDGCHGKWQACPQGHNGLAFMFTLLLRQHCLDVLTWAYFLAALSGQICPHSFGECLPSLPVEKLQHPLLTHKVLISCRQCSMNMHTCFGGLGGIHLTTPQVFIPHKHTHEYTCKHTHTRGCAHAHATYS